MGTDGVHYQRPGWFTKHVFNPIVAAVTRLGISVMGSRVLRVRGTWRELYDGRDTASLTAATCGL